MPTGAGSCSSITGKLTAKPKLGELRLADRVKAWIQRQRHTGQVGKWVILTGFVGFNLGYGFFLVGKWSGIVASLQATHDMCVNDLVR